MGALSERNVQGMVPEETHKALRDIAYVKRIALRDLVREVLIEYAANTVSQTKQAQA